MITVLAEKPSVARELAALLGAGSKKDGYLEGNGYCVTWALGHLIALGLPEDYGIRGFQESNLPIIPSPFVLTPRKETGKNKLLPNKRIVRQLAIIGELFSKSESIIVATDAGREGELIFRYIYDYLNCKKPFSRLWVSSLMEKALSQGLANLLPGNDFDALYMAARARSYADWLVGINGSQALTIAAGSGVYSLGRVQTPTLVMVCKQFQACQNHIPVKYWQLQLTLTKAFIEFNCTGIVQYDTLEKGHDAMKSMQRQSHIRVTDIKTETIKEAAPLLFDLTALQKEANGKYGLSAAETLDIAQSLYEKQFITYPRTGSKYITEDLWGEIPVILRALRDHHTLGGQLSKIKFSGLNKHIVNQAKVTDHHGLLVTEKVPSALSAKEETIYRMIALRLMEALSEVCVREIITTQAEALHHAFAIKSGKILEAGWRGIQNEYDDHGESERDIPELQTGDQLRIIGCTVMEKQRKAPQLFTEASLLTAMERAATKTTDASEKRALEGLGIGTPATRAAIIEGLLQRGYIERNGKVLVPTAKGNAIYELVAEMRIGSVAMTAQWEIALAGIEAGSINPDDFQIEIEKFTRNLTTEVLQAKVHTENVPEVTCPKCQVKHLQIDDKIVKCPDIGCGWIQFRKVCGVVIPLHEIENLVRKRTTSLIKGMASKSGKKFNARLALNDKSEVIFNFAR